jgi:hypothetical protein
MNQLLNYNYTSILLDISIPLITIPFTDILLCKICGTKARWFQLHSIINGVIVYIIFKDIFNLISNPLDNITNIDSKLDSWFIVVLHIYHLFIVPQLTFMDYFHHILFVGFGVLPSILYYNNNLIRLAWFPTCGLPGCIEYLMLTLVKHNKLNYINQKRINSYVYNYFRYPLTIYGLTVTYVAYHQNLLPETNPYIIIYFNLILFFNGAFYNKVTVENYILHEYKINNSFHNLTGLHE